MIHFSHATAPDLVRIIFAIGDFSYDISLREFCVTL